MQQTIPSLNCLWNDVLHFSAIPPQDLKNALLESGVEVGEMKFYEIDPDLLNPKNTTVYLYKVTSRQTKLDPENFAEYIPSDLDKYTTIPETTKEYYREKISSGSQPLLHVNIPHILYKGEININHVPIVTV